MKKIIKRIRLGLLLFFYAMKGGDEGMAVVYATLIINGLWTFDRVAPYFKEQTKEVLINLGASDLVTD